MGGNQIKENKYWYENQIDYQRENEIVRNLDIKTNQGYYDLNVRGLVDNSLNFVMVNRYEKGKNEIYEEMLQYGYVVLLYFYGRIAGLPSYDKMIIYYGHYLNRLLNNDFSVESRHFIHGGLFPMPIEYDSEDWPPYYLKTLTEYNDVKDKFPTEIERAFNDFMLFYGLKENSFKIEISNETRFIENFHLEDLSRFVRVLFVMGLWGEKSLFVKFKYFVFHLFSQNENLGKVNRNNKWFSILILTRFYEKNEKESSELFLAMKLAMEDKKTLHLFADKDINLSFQVQGLNKKEHTETTNISLFQDILTQLNKKRGFETKEGSWFLYNTKSGLLHEINLSSRFLMEPVCWKNCNANSSKFVENFKWYLISEEKNEKLASLPNDLFTNTKNYRFIYQTKTQLPSLNHFQKNWNNKKKPFEINESVFQKKIMKPIEFGPNYVEYNGPKVLRGPTFDEIGEFTDKEKNLEENPTQAMLEKEAIDEETGEISNPEIEPTMNPFENSAVSIFNGESQNAELMKQMNNMNNSNENISLGNENNILEESPDTLQVSNPELNYNSEKEEEIPVPPPPPPFNETMNSNQVSKKRKTPEEKTLELKRIPPIIEETPRDKYLAEIRQGKTLRKVPEIEKNKPPKRQKTQEEKLQEEIYQKLQNKFKNVNNDE